MNKALFHDTKAFISELKAFLGTLHDCDAAEVEWERGDYGFKITRGASKKQPQAFSVTNGKNKAPTPLLQIASPVVGVFHFLEKIEVGSTLNAKQSLGYVSAMNVKHTIQVEDPGKLLEVFVKEGQPVEFGQILFTFETPHVS